MLLDGESMKLLKNIVGRVSAWRSGLLSVKTKQNSECLPDGALQSSRNCFLAFSAGSQNLVSGRAGGCDQTRTGHATLNNLDQALDILYQAEKQSVMGHHMASRLFIQKAMSLIATHNNEQVVRMLHEREVIRAKPKLELVK